MNPEITKPSGVLDRSFQLRAYFTALSLSGLITFAFVGLLVIFCAVVFGHGLKKFEQARTWDVAVEAVHFSPGAFSDKKARIELLEIIETLNPSISAYLLDRSGAVLDRAELHPTGARVRMEPIKRALSPSRESSIVVGDDPDEPDAARVFSVAALPANAGYLYLVNRASWFSGLQGVIKLFRDLQFAIWAIVAFAMVFTAVFLHRLFGTLLRLYQLLQSYREGDLEATFQSTGDDDVSRAGRHLSDRAREACAQKSEFENAQRQRRALFGRIVHDLRSPLASLDAALQSLSHEPIRKLPRTVEQLLKAIYSGLESYDRMGKSLARFQTGKLSAGTGNFQPVVLNDVAAAVSDRLQPIAISKGITLQHQLPSERLIVSADGELLDRALSNLAINALKHTASGGKISIRVEQVGRNVLLQVIDSGEGIDSTELEKIFAERYRGKNASETGAGIGLAFVREVAKLHYGEATATSTRGEGASFSIVIPIEPLADDPSNSIRPPEDVVNQSHVSSGLSVPDMFWWVDIVLLIALCPPHIEPMSAVFRIGLPALLIIILFGTKWCGAQRGRTQTAIDDKLCIVATVALSILMPLFLFRQVSIWSVAWFAICGVFIVDCLYRMRRGVSRVAAVTSVSVGCATWIGLADRLELPLAFFLGGIIFHILTRKPLLGGHTNRLMLKLVASFGYLAFIISIALIYSVYVQVERQVRLGSPPWSESARDAMRTTVAKTLSRSVDPLETLMLLNKINPSLEFRIIPQNTPTALEDQELTLTVFEYPGASLYVRSLSRNIDSLLKQFGQWPLMQLLLLDIGVVALLCAVLMRLGAPRVGAVLRELSEAVTSFDSEIEGPPVEHSKNQVIGLLDTLSEELREQNQRIEHEERRTKELIHSTQGEIALLVRTLRGVVAAISAGDTGADTPVERAGIVWSVSSDNALRLSRGLVGGEGHLMASLFLLARHEENELSEDFMGRCSPIESLSAAVIELSAYANAHAVSLVQAYAEDEPPVKGSESMLDGVCRAALQGAITAAGTGGRVTLTTNAIPDGMELWLTASSLEPRALAVPLGFVVARDLSSFARFDLNWDQRVEGELTLRCALQHSEHLDVTAR